MAVKSPVLLILMFLCGSCMAGYQTTGKISPGFQGAQMNWIDKNGLFLISNNSNFAFGFQSIAQDNTKYLLVVIHQASLSVIWSANRNSPVENFDFFTFTKDGKVSLKKGNAVVWTPDTKGKTATSLELRNSGNLVLIGEDESVIWESFRYPTNTLISNQMFFEGMKLVSDPSSSNSTYTLEIKSGDMILSVNFGNFATPQPYWSVKKDSNIIIDKASGMATEALIDANSWKFYDRNSVLLWQYVFGDSKDSNFTWIAVVGSDGFISLENIDDSGSSGRKIPTDTCSRPESCSPYNVCSSNNQCRCISGLAGSNCETGFVNSCSGSNKELVNAGNGLDYPVLGFISPNLKTTLEGCKSSCDNNCSCLALFFHNSTGNCFIFDKIGSFKSSGPGPSSYVAFVKISKNLENSENNKKHFPYVAIIIVATILIIFGIIYVAYRFFRKGSTGSLPDSSEDENFLEGLSGMPIRYTYKDLQTATNNFSVKLGHGGFGSVYDGVLPDGTRLAVKKLEGIGQGKKEFRAEVSIIGSIHHHHLVRLRGFCAEGTHRMLAYEFMANGSLDRWIFKRQKDEFLLDWETRFSIAVGTAKGLAYLHEDCDVKIVHCDIKPENVLLDDNFNAKVSDFGLAKLMTREQSHVFTTLRGTRGYLAPEWITNYAISEKSDVYSYGMLLLEIIGGRKNFNPTESSEKSHFPSFAFKMMEEGKLGEILDSGLKFDEKDERVENAVKVALWCIQDDMGQRPSMTKVVQMLEGLCPVFNPPVSSPLGFRISSGFLKLTSSEGTTSSGPSDCNSDAYLSNVQLSGPR